MNCKPLGTDTYQCNELQAAFTHWVQAYTYAFITLANLKHLLCRVEKPLMMTCYLISKKTLGLPCL